MSSEKILVTGAQGKIGRHLVARLREKYGTENVIGSGTQRNPDAAVDQPFVKCDVSDYNQLEGVIKEHGINWIFHMAAILSMGCENNPQLGLKVNVEGFQNVMELARIYKIRVLAASSMAVFGPTTPKKDAPDVTILRPQTLYGCTKIHNELIGEFYYRKWGVDFRSIRIPTVLSDDGGDLRSRSVVGFAPYMFQEAVRSGRCTVDVAEHSALPYVFMDDCVDGTIQLMEAPNERLTLRSYNMQGFSATVGELAEEIMKHVPGFTISYDPSPVKQPLLDNVVDSVDDSNARHDWDWKPVYNMPTLVREMIARQRNPIRVQNNS